MHLARSWHAKHIAHRAFFAFLVIIYSRKPIVTSLQKPRVALRSRAKVLRYISGYQAKSLTACEWKTKISEENSSHRFASCLRANDSRHPDQGFRSIIITEHSLRKTRAGLKIWVQSKTHCSRITPDNCSLQKIFVKTHTTHCPNE